MINAFGKKVRKLKNICEYLKVAERLRKQVLTYGQGVGWGHLN
jgi:hypothetical protein